jgi:hypothetical protein
MFYATWHWLPRPFHFPQDPKLDRLLDSYFDPEIGYFRLPMFRRNARDLRKGLFGPEGLRDVPKGKGVRGFDLPNGWTLLLTYGERPNGWRKAGDVVAEFIPPTMRTKSPTQPQRPARSDRPVDPRPHALKARAHALGNCRTVRRASVDPLKMPRPIRDNSDTGRAIMIGSEHDYK